MDDENAYNLKPLRWVVLGLTISTISRFLLNIQQLHIREIIYIFQIIGLVIVALGLRKVEKYVFFNKCYRCALWVTGILTGIWLNIFISNGKSFNLLIMVVTALFGFIFFIAIVSLFSYLLASIGQIAVYVGEVIIAKISKILLVVFTINLIISIYFSGIQFWAGDNIIYKIMSNIIGIASFVIFTTTYLFIYASYKRLDGKKILKLNNSNRKDFDINLF